MLQDACLKAHNSRFNLRLCLSDDEDCVRNTLTTFCDATHWMASNGRATPGTSEHHYTATTRGY